MDERLPRRYWVAQGFTLLEGLVVIAILGVLLSVGAVMLQSPSARTFANDVRAQIQQARFEAVKRNRPVAIVWLADEERLETRQSTNPAINADACQGTIVLNARSSREYRAVEVVTTMGDGMVWLPNGQARTCAGGLDVASETTITGPDGVRRVVVSLAGRVAVE